MYTSHCESSSSDRSQHAELLPHAASRVTSWFRDPARCRGPNSATLGHFRASHPLGRFFNPPHLPPLISNPFLISTEALHAAVDLRLGFGVRCGGAVMRPLSRQKGESTLAYWWMSVKSKVGGGPRRVSVVVVHRLRFLLTSGLAASIAVSDPASRARAVVGDRRCLRQRRWTHDRGALTAGEMHAVRDHGPMSSMSEAG